MKILSHEQIKAITMKDRPTAQRRALAAMGIKHIIRCDGSPVVLDEAVREAHGLAADATEMPTLNLKYLKP